MSLNEDKESKCVSDSSNHDLPGVNDNISIKNDLDSINKSDNSEFKEDIESGSNILNYFGYFEWIKEYFDLSTSDYLERCLAALYPYMCIKITPRTLFNSLKDKNRSISIDIEKFPVFSNSSSDDQIHVDLHNEDEIELDLSKAGQSRKNSNSIMDGIKLEYQSKLYKTLCSMTQYPDLYGPFWINIMASSSLFFSTCFSERLASVKTLLPLVPLFELIFLSISCTLLMATSIFLCNYYFVRKINFKDFISFISVCGYTQIPLALLCKLCILISLLMFFHPLHFILLSLKVFTYFYLFFSTSITLYISLASLDNPKNTFKYKTSSVLSSYLVQSLFLTLIQKYIH
ncbi:uncharacterized protein TA10860 [Theileria annulata]|uniref:Uncharacterized protein n=1 Tax=Theileria annulata TaxID=5874 RepID=Q4U8F6_THEAN|nr:uncharacterized protein TA10860 [Theileria annulata]CAI76897.1 hypothetical protein TA10860 [Theileria annulata]|eukprot:XP_953522.1 hypothetical protein TA10860 [Theileria annulata]